MERLPKKLKNHPKKATYLILIRDFIKIIGQRTKVCIHTEYMIQSQTRVVLQILESKKYTFTYILMAHGKTAILAILKALKFDFLGNFTLENVKSS